jgi:hypothetical protein
MAVYMIAYELHEGEDYEGDLIKAIKALPSGGSWHNLGSTWFVISKEAAVQIHNSLKRHVLDGDKLAVVQCGNWGAWSGFNDEGVGMAHECLEKRGLTDKRPIIASGGRVK